MNFVFTALFTFIMMFNWRGSHSEGVKEPKTINEMAKWINEEHIALGHLISSGDAVQSIKLIKTIKWHLNRLDVHIKPQVSVEYGSYINSLILGVNDRLSELEKFVEESQFDAAKGAYADFSSSWQQLNEYGLRYAAKWEELRLTLSEQKDVNWSFNDTIQRFFNGWYGEQPPPPSNK
jgi:hypothetical protein